MPNFKRAVQWLGVLVAFAIVDHVIWNPPVWASNIAIASYNLVQNGGTPLTQRSTLNCSTGMSCSDDSVNKVTTLTAVGSGGSVTSVGCGTGLTGGTITTTGTCALDANVLIRSFGAAFDGGGSALTSGKTTYFTVPFACTIAAYSITADTGTASFDVWKIATGTAIPTVANTIISGTSYLSLSTGTAVHSTSTAAFTTTTVSANDIVGVNLQAVSGATELSLVIQCNAS